MTASDSLPLPVPYRVLSIWHHVNHTPSRIYSYQIELHPFGAAAAGAASAEAITSVANVLPSVLPNLFLMMLFIDKFR